MPSAFIAFWPRLSHATRRHRGARIATAKPYFGGQKSERFQRVENRNVRSFATKEIMTQTRPRRWPTRPRRTSKLDALDLAPFRPTAPCEPQPTLSLDELIAFLGDRDEAFRLLRVLRIPAYDPERLVRVPVDRVRAWQARHRT
jgi:hypothetical protein